MATPHPIDLESLARARSRRRWPPAPATPRRWSRDSDRPRGPGPRRRGREPDRGGRAGLGVRAWIDGRVGYAYGTDLAERGVAAIAARAVEAARVADHDEFAAAPEPAGAAEALPGLADPVRRRVAAPSARSSSRWPSSAPRSPPIPRVAAVETTVFVDAAARSRSPPRAGVSRRLRVTQLLRLPAGDRRGRRRPADRARLRPRPRARRPRPGGDRREGGGARDLPLLGADKPASRTCPVVLDETVAASFAGFIGGVLCADAVQRGRSPVRRPARRGDRLGRAHPLRRRRRPRGAGLGALRRRGHRPPGARR